VLCGSERVWQLSGFKVLFGAQPGEGKGGDIDARNRVAGLLRTTRISISQRVAEMAAARVRVALNNHHMRHLADSSTMSR